MEANKPKENPNPIYERVDKETEILRGDLLLKNGEWKMALHIYFTEKDRDRLIAAALKFKNEGNEDAYEVALRHIQSLEMLEKNHQRVDN